MEKTTILSLIERHYQQTELFYYQNRRNIPRPNTRYVHVAVWCGAYLCLMGFCVFLNVVVQLPLYYEMPVSLAVYAWISEYFLRRIGIKAVECYQHYAKEETRRNCLCVPSCSEYAILCLKKYVFILALWKIRKRLFVTCKGSDYIIDHP